MYLHVARNEIKNASFAQRSVHREGKNMATRIDWTGCGAHATRARTTTDVQIGGLRLKDFATVQYFIQLPAISFGFSESADVGLSFYGKNGNIFGQILRVPGNVRKLEWSRTLVDHKNALVFYQGQAVSGKSPCSFSYRWTHYNKKKKQRQSISSSRF